MLAHNDEDRPMSKYEKAGLAAEVKFVAQALADAHWKEPGSDPSGWTETAFNLVIAIKAVDAFESLPATAEEEYAADAEEPVVAPEGGKKRGKSKETAAE